MYIEEPMKREFYIEMSKSGQWSVRQLSGRINSLLFERTAISKKPDVTNATFRQMSAQLLYLAVYFTLRTKVARLSVPFILTLGNRYRFMPGRTLPLSVVTASPKFAFRKTLIVKAL